MAVGALDTKPKDIPKLLTDERNLFQEQAIKLKKQFNTSQKYLRGLFGGGTLCYEAQVIWKDMGVDPLYSNAPLPGGNRLTDSTVSQGHAAIDLGEEEFTVGRPHPMIDNDLRIRRMLQEASDPSTAVILLDIVLGYGAHMDPAAELAPAAKKAKELAGKEGRNLQVVASITGTTLDPQGIARQAQLLEEAGVILCNSNANAAQRAGYLVNEQVERKP
jgi:FdrA protein